MIACAEQLQWSTDKCTALLSDVRHPDTARRHRQRDRGVPRGPKAKETWLFSGVAKGL